MPTPTTCGPSGISAIAPSNHELIMYALTLKQPWAHLVIHGEKDIENRVWPLPDCHKNQWIALHAGKGYVKGISDIPKSDLTFGAIIGFIKFSDCITNSSSEWAMPNHFHWVISEKKILRSPIPCNGALKFWTPENSINLNLRRSLL